ncbi:hypothetical protein QVD17_28976 [Tagetes erecta]|uniref:NLP1-9 GAF domain-containing protein n=1 Tax=Tagetes erecta TaxID=13708 RepID=A0AAD8NST5_TARER|nr:hypothetical protein QVD17_28976 [Tagetes erecta]
MVLQLMALTTLSTLLKEKSAKGVSPQWIEMRYKVIKELFKEKKKWKKLLWSWLSKMKNLELPSVQFLDRQEVDLTSFEDSNTQKIKVNNGFYHPALAEIFEALKCACMMHNLPLAQTWIPCIKQGGKGGCRHSNENLNRCISTIDSASYISDIRFKDFQEACSEHHLFIGQGVVGKAFKTNESFSYSSDVTSFMKTEYPLAHHAKIFDLHAAVAIRVRTTYAATVDFVLEFFLPVDCKKHEEQKGIINSLFAIIRKVCGSLSIVVKTELHDEGVNEGLVIVSDPEPVPKVQELDGHDHGPVSGSSCQRNVAKTEKTITLEMIRQHFAGSLKDAAKNIGGEFMFSLCKQTLRLFYAKHNIHY